jgi:tetratricopeptide (TPR) repeat protein
MRFKGILPSLFLMSTLGLGPGFQPGGVMASAQELTQNRAELQFKAGISAFQKNDLKQARVAFQESLQSDPLNPASLFNLGLVEQKSGNFGLALALWRKALAHTPGYDPALEAVRFASSKLERREIAHEASLWESLRTVALLNIALYKYVVLCAVFLLLSGWLLLRYFGARRRALLDEQPLPPFPTVATIFAAGFLLTAFLSAAKAYDQSMVRATILPKKVEARSTPDNEGTMLFDLYEGLEVVVGQLTGEWAQVTYPGGSTGWVPKTAIFMTDEPVAVRPADKGAEK